MCLTSVDLSRTIEPVAGNPVLSVIIPAFNAASYVTDTLASLLAQSLDGFEILVVDGGSSDGTAEQVRRFPGIRLIEKPDMSYLEGFWNGLANARGRYVMQFCMSDMLVDELYLEAAVHALDSCPDASLVWALNGLADQDGHLLEVSIPAKFADGLPDDEGLFQFWLLTAYAISETNFVVRRSVLESCMPSVMDAKAAEIDPWLEFNFRFHTSGFSACPLPRVASALRMHDDSNIVSEQASGVFDVRLNDYLAKVRSYRESLLSGDTLYRPVAPDGSVLRVTGFDRSRFRRSIALWWIQERVTRLGGRALSSLPDGLGSRARVALRSIRNMMMARGM